MKNAVLSKEELKQLKSNLKSKKKKKEAELKTVMNLLKDQKEYIKSNDMDYDSDASKIRNREMLQSMKRRAKNKIRKFDSALQKIKLGKYGICEKTGKNISFDRLMALPEARTCMRRKK